MPLPNDAVESVLVHQNEYDTYAVANRMARRLLENDKYLEGLRGSEETDIYTTTTTGQVCVVKVGVNATVTVSHTLATNYPVVTLVDANGNRVDAISVQYFTSPSTYVVIHLASSLVPDSVIWHCRLA